MSPTHRTSLLLAMLLCASPAAFAQSTTPPAPQTPPANTSTTDGQSKAGPEGLSIYFPSGSSILRAQDKAVLDKASRAYNEGKPIVMILTGSSDRAGTAEANLILSQRRATAVLNGLLSRGIPADRFQVVAKGETDLPVPTGQGIPEAKNRRVEITWR